MRFIWFVLMLLVSGLVQAQDFAVELSAMNLLYKGIDNPVRISVSGVSNDNIAIRTSSNIRLENGTIKVISGKQAYVQVGEIKNADTNWIGRQLFRIRELPYPTARLGGLSNDGLPKHKASVVAQTSVVAIMGSSFAFNLEYKVSSFTLIAVYKNRQIVSFKSLSPKISSQMRKAIDLCQPGDIVVVEGITSQNKDLGLTNRLAPIVITLKGKSVYSNVSPLYARFYDLLKDSSYYSENYLEITTILDSFKTGVIEVYAKGSNGYTSRVRIYEDFKVKAIKTYDDNQILLSKKTKNSDTTWKYEKFSNGSLVIRTTITDKAVLYANEKFRDCRRGAHAQKNSDYTDTFCINQLEKDLLELYVKDNVTCVDSFTSYYQNGQLKVSGILMENKTVKLDFRYYYDSCPYHILMHGTWLFYNPDGTLLETREYNMGVLME